MFFVIVVLAIIGLASLLGATVSSTAAAFGALVFLPILLFKLFLVVAFFGFIGKRWQRSSGRPRPRWQGWDDSSRRDEEPSDDERFEEWHRLAHAKDEVDSWTPER